MQDEPFPWFALFIIKCLFFRTNVIAFSRHIKATSPKLMMAVILGFMSVLPSSVIFGLMVSTLHYNISEPVANGLCIVRYF